MVAKYTATKWTCGEANMSTIPRQRCWRCYRFCRCSYDNVNFGRPTYLSQRL